MKLLDIITDLYGHLLGRHASRSRPRGRIGGRGAYLFLLAAVFCSAVLLCAFVTAMDPYDLYGWGPRAKLDRDYYNNSPAPWVLNIVTSAGYDTLLIGGSTADNYRSSDMQRLLTGSKRAFNLSYSAPRPRDLRIVMQKVSAAKGLHRVLLSLDSSFLLPADAKAAQFPEFLYDKDPTNDLRAVDAKSVTLSARLLTGREFIVSAWDAGRNEKKDVAEYRLTQQASFADAARELIDSRRPHVAAPSALTCSDLPDVNLIGNFARALAARGIRLDVIVPPYSYYLYYKWLDPEHLAITHDAAPLTAFILLRRCALAQIAGNANAHMFALDLQPQIVQDMANYKDEAHLFGLNHAREILADVNAGRNELTPGNFDAYAAELRRRVATYVYYDSRLQERRP
jgi:hypothetical protein